MLKGLLIGVLLLVIGAGAVYGLFAIPIAEPQRISLNGLTTPLFIPAEIRETPQVGICGEVLVSLSWQECGGVCGVYYRLDYPSTEPEQNVIDLVAEYATGFPEYEVTITNASSDSEIACSAYSIEYFMDFTTQ